MDRPIWLGYCVMSLLHPSVEFSPVPPQLLFLCVQAINKSCSMTSVHLGKGGGIFWKFRFKHGKLCSLGQWEMDFKWDWSEYTLVPTHSLHSRCCSGNGDHFYCLSRLRWWICCVPRVLSQYLFLRELPHYELPQPIEGPLLLGGLFWARDRE